MASADPPEGEWIWRWTLEHRRVAGASGGSIEIFWLGLPGWFERGVEPEET